MESVLRKRRHRNLESAVKKVLVMMSTYNGEQFIKEQVESIIVQKTTAEVYLRIRDDGSTDKTCDVIFDLQKRYPGKIELIKGKNKGCNASFFELINSAEGYDYYSISDQDDVWMENKIQTAILFLEGEEKELPLLYASTSFLTGDDLIPYGTTRRQERVFSVYNTIIQNICPGHTQVMNDALLKKIQGEMDVTKVYVYDSWITNMAMLYGKVIFDNNSYTLYRQHTGNQMGSGKGVIGQLVASAKRSYAGDGHKYREQIEYFLEFNKEELERQGCYKEIYEFLSAKNIFKKLLYLCKGKLFRQRKIETIAFYAAWLCGRY